jgi:hypothetical protein
MLILLGLGERIIMTIEFKNLKSEYFTDCRIGPSGDNRGLCAIFKDKAYNLKNGKRMAETIYTEEILTQRVLSARARKESRPMEEAALAELQARKAATKPSAAQRRAAKLLSDHP